MKRWCYTIILLAGIIGLSFLDFSNPRPYRLEIPRQFPPLPDDFEQAFTMEGLELGRKLFFDPILSLDSSISCAGCHRPEYAFSDFGKPFSSGSNDRIQRRNTPGLFNLAWSEAFFWDGRAKDLKSQALEVVSGHTELNLEWKEAVDRISSHENYPELFKAAYPNKNIDSNLVVDALVQFQFSLISQNSKYDRVIRGEDFFTEEEYLGFVFVNDQGMGNCLHCHTTDAHGLGTNGGFANNGLDSISQSDKGRYEATANRDDLGKFKVPSLRNLLFTAPYMHDGRFETLSEVIDFYSEGVKPHRQIDPNMNYFMAEKELFSEAEKSNILAFLKTLTDSSFVSNLNYQNPN
jgi:cytochrome c peroxidase